MRSISRSLHRPSRRTSLAASLLAIALLASTARSDVLPFVDNYKTNVSANSTESSNAVLNLLKGFDRLWTPGSTWNTGTPTAQGAPILSQNIQYVVNVTQARTADQATAAYLDDRRNQSYSVISGLGSLAPAYYAGSGAVTTITGVAADATSVAYNDAGTGAGSTSSALGNVVALVNTLRGNFSSTTPPKNYFLYPRPWRQSDDVIVLPTLVPVKSPTPATDSGFPSGHTNAGYLAALALAYSTPQRFDEMVLRASELGDNRILAGMHSPLDVIGGRMEATALAAAILNDPANTALKTAAYNQAQTYFSAALSHDAVMSQSDYVANKALYTARLTYGLSPIGDTTQAALVPKGAEALIESRFSYLDTTQRREVLRTTEIASGQALDDAEGWSRLNLYAAGGGYGRFDSTVTVTMDASQGGTSAKDYWRNDISGTGGLVKQGTGNLVLTGNNTYSGSTLVQGGQLTVDGQLASAVTVQAGATLGGSGTFHNLVTLNAGSFLAPGDSAGTITFADGLTLHDGVTLRFQLGTLSDRIVVNGGLLTGTEGMGNLILDLEAADGFAAGTYTLFDFTGASTWSFDASDFVIGEKIEGYDYRLALAGTTLQLTATAVPEPATYGLFGAALAVVVATLRRRRRG